MKVKKPWGQDIAALSNMAESIVNISLRYPELNRISRLGPLYFIFMSSTPLPPSSILFADIVNLSLFFFPNFAN